MASLTDYSLIKGLGEAVISKKYLKIPNQGFSEKLL